MTFDRQQERLLAREAAEAQHLNYGDGAGIYCLTGHHGPFSTCPHVACVGTRGDTQADDVTHVDGQRAALERIWNYYGDCRCEHDDENCCALLGETEYCCPYCIAAHALGKATFPTSSACVGTREDIQEEELTRGDARYSSVVSGPPHPSMGDK